MGPLVSWGIKRGSPFQDPYYVLTSLKVLSLLGSLLEAGPSYLGYPKTDHNLENYATTLRSLESSWWPWLCTADAADFRKHGSQRPQSQKQKAKWERALMEVPGRYK